MSKTIFKIVGIVVLIGVLIAASIIIMMLAWQWVVPDVFAGAVAHGVLPATISAGQAVKLCILLWAFGITVSAGNKKK